MKLTEDQNGNSALEILRHFYPEETPLRKMLLKHSFQVCRKALQILRSPACPALQLDRDTVIVGALLHDLGIGCCHAADIFCTGPEPYIAHGILGARMLREYAGRTGKQMERYARICERHTGSGLTAEDIRRQHLPLPEQDYLPETPEEKLICLADKFFSKSGSMKEKSLPQITRSMQKFGPGAVSRWQKLCRDFGIEIQ